MISKSLTQVVLDTNFIISLLKQRRDIESEIRSTLTGPTRIMVTDLVVLELERLARRGRSSVQALASSALAFLAKGNFAVLEHHAGPTDVDTSLVQVALSGRNATAIATLDGKLRTSLRSFEIPAISPRIKHGLIASRVHH